MLDHRTLADAPEAISLALARRGAPREVLVGATYAVGEWRAAQHRAEGLRREMNQAQRQVGDLARAGRDAEVAGARAKLRDLKAAIKAADEAADASTERLRAPLMALPNLPHPEVPNGEGPEDNVVVRAWGAPRPAEGARPHWELAADSGVLDFARAATLSGARFVVAGEAAARLERALAALMLDIARARGHREVGVPLLVLPTAMEVAGQYPKFRGDAFATEGHEHVLIPTAEVPLVNLHAHEILAAEALPVRLAAYTPCFRRESGSAGRDTRGLIRLHQFNKVEVVSLVAAEGEEAELARMVAHAELVLTTLELPHRVVELCAKDLGFAATRTFDLEVWLPGQGAYREISSVSSCGDFQARRGQLRWRPSAAARPRLLHTLNGSALAVGRTLVALMENGQQADGSIALPPALAPYLGGARRIDGRGNLTC